MLEGTENGGSCGYPETISPGSNPSNNLASFEPVSKPFNFHKLLLPHLKIGATNRACVTDHYEDEVKQYTNSASYNASIGKAIHVC